VRRRAYLAAHRPLLTAGVVIASSRRLQGRDGCGMACHQGSGRLAMSLRTLGLGSFPRAGPPARQSVHGSLAAGGDDLRGIEALAGSPLVSRVNASSCSVPAGCTKKEDAGSGVLSPRVWWAQNVACRRLPSRSQVSKTVSAGRWLVPTLGMLRSPGRTGSSVIGSSHTVVSGSLNGEKYAQYSPPSLLAPFQMT
jgi:hypothetical protein